MGPPRCPDVEISAGPSRRMPLPAGPNRAIAAFREITTFRRHEGPCVGLGMEFRHAWFLCALANLERGTSDHSMSPLRRFHSAWSFPSRDRAATVMETSNPPLANKRGIPRMRYSLAVLMFATFAAI